MSKKYVVKLTVDERGHFERVAHTGKSTAWKVAPGGYGQLLLIAICGS